MMTLKIPLTKFSKINGMGKLKWQTIECDTTYSSGVLDYIDFLGICRRNDDSEITTAHQANVVLKLNSNEELIEALKIYEPTTVSF